MEQRSQISAAVCRNIPQLTHELTRQQELVGVCLFVVVVVVGVVVLDVAVL